MISLPGSTLALSFGSKPSIDKDVTDFPLPDSPTNATVAFLGMSKLIPLTASKVVCSSRRKLTRRLRTERSGSIVTLKVTGIQQLMDDFLPHPCPSPRGRGVFSVASPFGRGRCAKRGG